MLPWVVRSRPLQGTEYVTKHNCWETSKSDVNGVQIYTYICSRCRGCYVCKHKALLFEDGTWHWKCKDGKIREVINDGRIKVE